MQPHHTTLLRGSWELHRDCSSQLSVTLEERCSLTATSSQPHLSPSLFLPWGVFCASHSKNEMLMTNAFTQASGSLGTRERNLSLHLPLTAFSYHIWPVGVICKAFNFQQNIFNCPFLFPSHFARRFIKLLLLTSLRGEKFESQVY